MKKTNKRRVLISGVAGALAFVMILALILSALPTTAFAAKSSSELKSELSDLEKKAEAIRQKKEELKKDQQENASQTKDIVQQKSEIDEQIALLHEEIENTNAQIQSYSLLISAKQKELDEAQSRQKELNEKYLLRIRTMEESGQVQYWSVIFKARSFSDLLDRINMISEIAAADQAMMQELDDVAKEIQTAQADLAAEKESLQAEKDRLAESQTELDEKRAENDELLRKLKSEADELSALEEKYDAEKQRVSDEIAQAEKEYNEAKQREEEERRRQEEANKPTNPTNPTNPTTPTTPTDPGDDDKPSESTWRRPVSTLILTSRYGYRGTHPVTGKPNDFHNGVDLAMPEGSPVYATRSGTVTMARLSDSWGNQVVINHGDGFSSMYAHMVRYTVSVGEYVQQGEVIGYVGMTGWATGPHLHFTIYYNGSTVNPMNYIS